MRVCNGRGSFLKLQVCRPWLQRWMYHDNSLTTSGHSEVFEGRGASTGTTEWHPPHQVKGYIELQHSVHYSSIGGVINGLVIECHSINIDDTSLLMIHNPVSVVIPIKELNTVVPLIAWTVMPASSNRASARRREKNG